MIGKDMGIEMFKKFPARWPRRPSGVCGGGFGCPWGKVSTVQERHPRDPHCAAMYIEVRHRCKVCRNPLQQVYVKARCKQLRRRSRGCFECTAMAGHRLNMGPFDVSPRRFRGVTGQAVWTALDPLHTMTCASGRKKIFRLSDEAVSEYALLP